MYILYVMYAMYVHMYVRMHACMYATQCNDMYCNVLPGHVMKWDGMVWGEMELNGIE